jgi:hypothetical protein
MSAMTMSASLTKVTVPTQGRKTVARRGAVKVQANMWPVSRFPIAIYIFSAGRVTNRLYRANTAPRLDPLPDLATPFRSNRSPEPTPAPPTRTRPPLSATTTSCP